MKRVGTAADGGGGRVNDILDGARGQAGRE